MSEKGPEDRKTRRSREKQDELSVLHTQSGAEYSLLPGKTRGDVQGTLKGKGMFGSVRLCQDDEGKLLAVKTINLRPAAIKLHCAEDKEYNQFCEELKSKYKQEKGIDNLPASLVDFPSDLIDQMYNHLKPLEQSVLIDKLMAEPQHEVDVMKHLNKTADLVIVRDDKADKAYLVMELVAGRQVAKVFDDIIQNLKNKDLSDIEKCNEVKKYLNILINWCDALQDIHNKGVAHIDGHAGNVLYDETTGKLNLIDWGMSEILDSQYDPYEKTVTPLQGPAKQAKWIACKVAVGESAEAGIYRAEETVKLAKWGDTDNARLLSPLADIDTLAKEVLYRGVFEHFFKRLNLYLNDENFMEVIAKACTDKYMGNTPVHKRSSLQKLKSQFNEMLQTVVSLQQLMVVEKNYLDDKRRAKIEANINNKFQVVGQKLTQMRQERQQMLETIGGPSGSKSDISRALPKEATTEVVSQKTKLASEIHRAGSDKENFFEQIRRQRGQSQSSKASATVQSVTADTSSITSQTPGKKRK